jgi:TRAP transporter 4TM/12TM fusion protein
MPDAAAPYAPNWAARALLVLGLAAAAWHLAANWYGLLQPMLYTAAHLGLMTLLAFLATLPRGLAPRVAHLLLGTAGAVAFFYVAAQHTAMQERGIFPSVADQAFAVVAILCVLEATRRLYGPALPIIAIIVIAYGFSGDLLPVQWRHATWDLEFMTFNLFMGFEGLFGTATRISATLIVTFVMLGAFLERVGATDRIIALASALTARQAGGPAKVSVIASGMMGTVSGSAVANVVATGRVTIPFMIANGYRPPFAAAVEGVASTGGLLMPPIMGAGAFVMAELLGISYWTIAAAAVVPALLYYLMVFSAVHFEAKRRGAGGAVVAVRLGDAFVRSLPFLIPIAVLFAFIGLDTPPMRAALYTIVATILLGIVVVRPRSPRFVVEALAQGVREAAPIAIACACAGLIVGALTGTGFAIKFAGVLVDVAQGQPMVALVMAMLVVIFLGMALPATASYLIGAAVVAPPLIRIGFDPLAVHMFVFYFSNLSHITPPVDLATYAAASIAKTNPLTASMYAVALGSVAFVLPFIFIHHPVLLLIDFAWWPFVQILVPATAGIVLLAAALMGWAGARLSRAARVVLAAAALLLIHPEPIASLAGLCIALALLVRVRRAPPAPVRS